MAQDGGGVPGPSGPSIRITAWKWIAPRFRNSGTLPYESRADSFSSTCVSPARAAISRRRRVVKGDSQAARLRKGSRGGRPPGFDEERYKKRDSVERAINKFNHARAVATRYDKRG